MCVHASLSGTERDTSASEGKDRKLVTFANLDALHETKDRMTWKASSEQKLANLPRWPHDFGRTLAEFKKQNKHQKERKISSGKEYCNSYTDDTNAKGNA